MSPHKHTLVFKDMPATRVTIQDTATLDCVADVQLSWQSCWQAKSVARPSLSLATSDRTSSQFPGGCSSSTRLLSQSSPEDIALSGLCVRNGTPSKGSCVSVTLCVSTSSSMAAAGFSQSQTGGSANSSLLFVILPGQRRENHRHQLPSNASPGTSHPIL